MKTLNRLINIRTLLMFQMLLFNVACTVLGPNYVRPTIKLPAHYKETPANKGSTDSIAVNVEDRGKWWAVYHDSKLDELMEQVEHKNYSLQAVQAKVHQAESLVRIARSEKFLQLNAGGTNDLGILLGWEIDLWGRVQRNVEASKASLQATSADLVAARLSLQAQLAQNYFLLRVQDADIQLLTDTVAAYSRSLEISRNQYAAGVVGQGNIAQAEAQLSTAKVEMYNAQVVRAQFEHAIAVLVGQVPSLFTIEVSDKTLTVPGVPTVFPSELLERRPDIVAAERRVAVASAQIGVAKAQTFPSLSLSVGASIAKGSIGGSKLLAPLYTSGKLDAKKSKALRVYDESVANYKQTILNGFVEVEDNLVSLKILAEAASAQRDAVKSSRKAVEVMQNQYQAGIVDYQSIVIVQASALINQRSALRLLGRRLVSTVTLIKALGGGWQANDMGTLNDSPEN